MVSELTGRLKLDDAGLTRLELCRSPRRDRSFRADIEVIADYVCADASKLGRDGATGRARCVCYTRRRLRLPTRVSQRRGR